MTAQPERKPTREEAERKEETERKEDERKERKRAEKELEESLEETSPACDAASITQPKPTKPEGYKE